MNKYVRGGLIGAVAVIMLLGSFSGGFLVGHFVPFQNSGQPIFSSAPEALPTVSPQQQSATPQDVQTLFKPFWEAWGIVHNQYVDQPVDDVALMQGAIRGMMDALGDKHSSYMDPQTYQDANNGLAGAYEGIGAWVDTTSDYLTIISPIPDSPAEKAGMQTGRQNHCNRWRRYDRYRCRTGAPEGARPGRVNRRFNGSTRG